MIKRFNEVSKSLLQGFDINCGKGCSDETAVLRKIYSCIQNSVVHLRGSVLYI